MTDLQKEIKSIQVAIDKAKSQEWADPSSVDVLIETWRKKEKLLVQEIQNAERDIDCLEDARLRDIMRRRYILGEGYLNIANDYFISERQLMNWFKDARRQIVEKRGTVSKTIQRRTRVPKSSRNGANKT